MKSICITHFDLDGLVSYLTLKWFFPNVEIPIETTTPQNFRDFYLGWLTKHNAEDYDKIFILDLDVAEHKDIIDKKNVIIIDHHDSHIGNKYEKAKAIVKESKSAAELVYNTFSKICPHIKLTKEQKILILLASDYDSYTLQIPESTQLNMIFWSTQNKFNTLIDCFKDGFKGFNLNQLNMIKLYQQEVLDIKKSLKIFEGTVNIVNKDRIVKACFATKAIDDLAHYLINDHNADIAIVVNTKTNRVSFRKKIKEENNDIDLPEFVKKICGENAGGHDVAAGGAITDKFLLFTKVLKEVK